MAAIIKMGTQADGRLAFSRATLRNPCNHKRPTVTKGVNNWQRFAVVKSVNLIARQHSCCYYSCELSRALCLLTNL